ncbi:hypothetical protein H9Q13_08990 [Pontibacter sp. JH31]|uniref:Uncharacterized protein n=1 Tax=Pontibacter aquaedesilientis TaxID=2766980 RepID=A0ABR7XG97_9BACT|nr:hypothetical protein [Pontibacter aquaedesilientis]MBD1397298.1 hypothetical protein [Pontibacter aquaedesilientis]
MKILILLFGMTAALGAAGTKTASDIKEIQKRNELKALEKYPNLLPEVVVTAPRISPDDEENLEEKATLEQP